MNEGDMQGPAKWLWFLCQTVVWSENVLINFFMDEVINWMVSMVAL